MIDLGNPYRPPKGSAEADLRSNVRPGSFDVVAFVAWPIAMAVNMVVPLWLGWEMTDEHGRVGMFMAACLFLASGWALCYCKPPAARRLILGAAISALSQLYPIAQFASGLIAVGIAAALGLVSRGEGMHLDRVSSELGGFVVTLLVGSFLLVFAGGSGLFLSLLLPQRLFAPNR